MNICVTIVSLRCHENEEGSGDETGDDAAIVCGGRGWSVGVVGIARLQFCERQYRCHLFVR